VDRNIQLKMNPLVSIIIPAYNAEEYLAETIESALAQTWPQIEIIIVDDGSADNTVAITKRFESDRVKICLQKNKGAAAARNRGLKEAKGQFVQFLDADDLLKADKIATQVKLLIEHNNALSICPVIHFDTTNREHLTTLKPSLNELDFYIDSTSPFDFLLKLYGAENNRGSMIPLHCWLTPANLIHSAGNWNEDLTINDDGEFFCRVVLQSKQIITALQTSCYYRKHTAKPSLSAGKNNTAFNSEYNAIMLKAAHLKHHSSTDPRVNKVTARTLMELLMNCYPDNKQLSNQIINDIKDMGGTNYQPVIGGKVIELLKQLFGWKVALLLKRNNPFR
jgi:glycosyltransferase involved in cell wall biosynthesis